MYKTEHCLENYFDIIPTHLLQHFMNFHTQRMCNHYLPIESERWSGLDRNDRLCNKYNLQEIVDEFHYLFNCTHLLAERNKFLSFKTPNAITYKSIMNENNQNKITKTCNFIKINLSSKN